jgi:hypothetical protein
MKRMISALLAALLLLSLAACGEKEPDDTPSGYDDSLISELYSEEGEYTDAENNTLSYRYHVPQIVSETAVAAALNAEIADKFGALVQEQKSMMAGRVSLTCLSVTWKSYWNDSLLCLVLTSEMDGDLTDYAVYSYDFFGGKRLTSEDLLAREGLSTQEFVMAARRTAANYFDGLYRDALSGSMGGADFIASYAERRAWTLSDENINAEMRLYLDGGALHMIVPVGSFAGAESYDADLALDLSARETVERTAQDSFVKARLSGGSLTVSFEKTADSAWYAENFRFDYETVYPVAGLYSDYTDVFVGSVGQGYFPYVFLLTKEGAVEYVNLLEGLTAGFLCDGGPLGGVKDIVAFESGTVEEEYGTYQTVFAVDVSGEKHDLSGPVSDADYTVPSEFLGEWTATVTHDTAEQGSYDSDYILTLSDGGGLTVQDINSEVGLYFEYTGQLNYLGTNGEGMVFGYHLNERAGTVRYGAFTLLRGEDGLHVKSVAGENFFDAPSGRATVFSRG